MIQGKKMTEEKQHCQVCNMQYDEGITARKDFVVPLEHLDQDLPEVFHDQSIERLRFCSVKCFFEFMIVICEKSKKMSEEEKPTNSTESDRNRFWSEKDLEENNVVPVDLPYAAKEPPFTQILENFTEKKLARMRKLAKAIRKKGLENALVELKAENSKEKEEND